MEEKNKKGHCVGFLVSDDGELLYADMVNLEFGKDEYTALPMGLNMSNLVLGVLDKTSDEDKEVLKRFWRGLMVTIGCTLGQLKADGQLEVK